MVDKDTGILTMLIERLEKYRLPRLLALKEKVDGALALDDVDLDFMERVLKDANKVIPLVARHPEYQELSTKLITLYNEITENDLQIEQADKHA